MHLCNHFFSLCILYQTLLGQCRLLHCPCYIWKLKYGSQPFSSRVSSDPQIQYLHAASIIACQHVGVIVANYKVIKQLSKCLIGEETQTGVALVELVQSAFICCVPTELLFGGDVAPFGIGLMCDK
jgi:hypothetical protein